MSEEFLCSTECCDFFFAVAVDVLEEADFCFRLEGRGGWIEAAFPIFVVLLGIKVVLNVDCW